MFEETAIHEAGHAIVWELESEYLGAVALVSAIPYADSTGRVRGVNGASGPVTPRRLRALGYMNAAGFIAERLAGFNTPALAAAKDARNLAMLEHISKCGARYIDEAKAGAELMLRSHWTAVERVADYLLTLGELTPPHGVELIRMALEGPQRVLAPDMEAFLRLCIAVEDVPEFAQQIETAAQALSAQA
jgi:hypothetical protein